jgi:hypothetical protein
MVARITTRQAGPRTATIVYDIFRESVTIAAATTCDPHAQEQHQSHQSCKALVVEMKNRVD